MKTNGESNLSNVLSKMNAESEGEFKLDHKFGNIFIQRNGVNLMNVTHVSGLSEEYIIETLKTKIF